MLLFDDTMISTSHYYFHKVPVIVAEISRNIILYLPKTFVGYRYAGLLPVSLLVRWYNLPVYVVKLPVTMGNYPFEWLN